MQDILNLFIYNIIPFTVILSILVFVHEFGHYWVARYNNVRVTAFSIGFGPEIFGWNDRAGTRWKICYIPLGGYVKMFSDLNAASQPNAEFIAQMSEEDKKVSLFHKSVGQRMAVSAAGPFFNYAFAIIILSVLYVFSGQRVPSQVAKIDSVAPLSAAARAGLQAQDIVTRINQTPIHTFAEMHDIVAKSPGIVLDVEVMRQNQKIDFKIAPDIHHKVGVLGVTQALDSQVIPIYSAPWHATVDVLKISASTLQSLGSIVTGQQSADSLSGPIGIAQLIGKTAQQDLSELLWLMAFLSISLGLINLIPIPMLDGGHLLFYAIEALRGRPIDEKTQDFCYKIGFACVLGLIVFSTWNDLSHTALFHFIKNLLNL